MSDILLKNLTEKFEIYQLESDRISFQVNSTLLIASATVLAVSTIIGEGLGTPGNTQCLHILLNRLTIGINALCILLLGISLYGYAIRARKLREELREAILYTLNHPGEEYVKVVDISNPKVFLICEKVAYISFVLYILGLAMLGLLK